MYLQIEEIRKYLQWRVFRGGHRACRTNIESRLLSHHRLFVSLSRDEWMRIVYHDLRMFPKKINATHCMWLNASNSIYLVNSRERMINVKCLWWRQQSRVHDKGGNCRTTNNLWLWVLEQTSCIVDNIGEGLELEQSTYTRTHTNKYISICRYKHRSLAHSLTCSLPCTQPHRHTNTNKKTNRKTLERCT